VFSVVALASRLTCQAGGSSAALKAIIGPAAFSTEEESHWRVRGDPRFQGAEKGCFEQAECTPTLILNAAIEIEGFRVKS